MTLLSTIYDVKKRPILRGQAKAGCIRPTIKEFFTSKDYTGNLMTLIGYTDDKCNGGTPFGTYAANEVALAFNNDPASVWISGNGAQSVVLGYNFSKATRIEKLRIGSGSSYYARSPIKFDIRAGNSQPTGTGEGTLLHSVVLEKTEWAANMWKELTFSNRILYQYYWIDMFETCATPPNNYTNVFYIGEIEMMEGVYE